MWSAATENYSHRKRRPQRELARRRREARWNKALARLAEVESKIAARP